MRPVSTALCAMLFLGAVSARADEATGCSKFKWSIGREQAAFPLPWVRESKYWPPVKRVDNAHGDRNLVCTCAPLEAYAQAAE